MLAPIQRCEIVAVFYRDGHWIDLAIGSGFTTAIPYGINSAGLITGIMRVGATGYPYHAALWTGFPTAATNISDIGYPGVYTNGTAIMDNSNNSISMSINQAGHCAGYAALTRDYYQAFLYEDGKMKSLGVIDGYATSFANGINNQDEVVGTSNTGISGAGGYNHAFIWDATHSMRDLNSLITSNSTWVLAEAYAINDRGQIVGSGIVGGIRHAFLLNPRHLRSLIVTQPASQVVPAGTNVVLSVSFLGTLPVSYQWQFNGVNVENATNTPLNLTGVKALQTGSYTIIITDANGQFTSQPALLTVQAPPQIDSLSSSAKVAQGTDVTLTVLASGSLPLSYQWRFGTTNLSGATNSTLTLPAVTPPQQGSYRVVVRNDFGTATSDAIQLQVFVPPKLSLAMYAGLTLEGELGQACRIEYVNALQDTNAWTELTTVVLTNRIQFYLDTTSPSHAKRYYRIVLAP